MTQTEALCWTDGRGNRIRREFNQTIDVSKYLGTPGYSLLIVAANTHLSVADIRRYLRFQSRETPDVERTTSWIQRRRWLFQPPGTDNTKRPQADLDGEQTRAVEIMRENPKMSVRGLSKLLRTYGIKRCPEWCRRHRCD